MPEALTRLQANSKRRFMLLNESFQKSGFRISA